MSFAADRMSAQKASGKSRKVTCSGEAENRIPEILI